MRVLLSIGLLLPYTKILHTDLFRGPFEFRKYRTVNNWFMLSVRISSYGCTPDVWGAREKRKS